MLNFSIHPRARIQGGKKKNTSSPTGANGGGKHLRRARKRLDARQAYWVASKVDGSERKPGSMKLK